MGDGQTIYDPTKQGLTAHGRARCRQRGTTSRMLAALLAWADIEAAVGSGAAALSISAKAEAEMHRAGLGADVIARARHRAVVLVNGVVVTVIVGRTARGCRYWCTTKGRRPGRRR